MSHHLMITQVLSREGGNLQAAACFRFPEYYEWAGDDYLLLSQFVKSQVVHSKGPVRTRWMTAADSHDVLFKAPVIWGRVWMQTCSDLSAAITLSSAQRDILYEGNRNKLHGFFYREIGYRHPPDVWIYGLVIPLWNNLAGTSAA